MKPGTVPAAWRDVFVLDEQTVQLGADDQAVRIIGPVQQTLDRVHQHLSAAGVEDAPGADDRRTPDRDIRVRARRQLAAVLVEGLPRPAGLVAEQLSHLQLGMLLLNDSRPVDHADVADGYSAAAVGQTRAVAVRRSCRRQNPEAAVTIRSAQTPEGLAREPVDIHVIFAQRAVSPAHLAASAALAQLVLPVVRDPDRWRIGPLLSRDRGPCPECLLLHGAATDPQWELLQTALAATSWGSRQSEPPLSAAVVASLVSREIQLAVDGEFEPQTASRMICVCAARGELSLVPVVPHPECSCRLHAAS